MRHGGGAAGRRLHLAADGRRVAGTGLQRYRHRLDPVDDPHGRACTTPDRTGSLPHGGPEPGQAGGEDRIDTARRPPPAARGTAPLRRSRYPPHEGHDLPGMVSLGTLEKAAATNGQAFDRILTDALRAGFTQSRLLCAGEQTHGQADETTELAAAIARSTAEQTSRLDRLRAGQPATSRDGTTVAPGPGSSVARTSIASRPPGPPGPRGPGRARSGRAGPGRVGPGRVGTIPTCAGTSLRDLNRFRAPTSPCPAQGGNRYRGERPWRSGSSRPRG